MPAFTIAAACRYALTGVGAAIAPGSQKWNGTIADLLTAPIRTSTIATSTKMPLDGGCATRSESRYEPVRSPSMMMPTSIASPPKVVTSSACVADLREVART